jgi:uncharacterized membrane protein YfhO
LCIDWAVHDEQHVTSAATQPTPASPINAGIDAIFTPARLCVLLFLLMLALFPEIILGSHAFFYRDAGLFGYPAAYYIKNSLWHGELPLWNPYSTCGIPFLAQWNTMVLYPGSLIYLAFPLPWSMNTFLLAHIFFAAIGMYKLALRLFGNHFGATVAGLAFAWNGLMLQCIMWPCNLASLAWMPWVVLLCERAWKRGERSIVWAALAGACQMLTGSPEFTLITWMIIAVWFVAASWQRRRWCWMDTLVLCGTAMLVAFLSAAQLLPTIDLIQHGDRTTSFAGGTWSMPWWGVANFFVPLFRCTPSVAGVWTQDEQQWTASYYVGVATLLLALIAIFRTRNLKTTLLTIAVLTGIVFAMGDNAGVLKIFKTIVPFLGFIRYPIKYIALTIFALPLLAAAGTSVFLGERCSKAFPKACVIIAVAALVVLAFIIGGPKEHRIDYLDNGISRVVACLIAVTLLVTGTKVRTTRPQIICLFAALIVMGVDICFHMPSQNPTVITAAYERRPPQMKTVPKLGESRAMVSAPVQVLMDNSAHPNPLKMYLGQRVVLFGNCNLLDCGWTNSTDYTCIPKVNGFYSLHLREQENVTKLLYSTNLPVPLAEFIGVSQVTSYEQLFGWDTFDHALPMATIGQQPVFADEQTTLQLLQTFNPRETLVLRLDLKSSVTATRDESARLLQQRVGTHEQRYVVETKHATMFVVAQTYFHDWNAFVDGKRVPLLRANEAYQAIEVPAGKHNVRLIYRDNWFYAGVALSAIGLLACAGIFFCSSRREDALTSPQEG